MDRKIKYAALVTGVAAVLTLKIINDKKYSIRYLEKTEELRYASPATIESKKKSGDGTIYIYTDDNGHNNIVIITSDKVDIINHKHIKGITYINPTKITIKYRTKDLIQKEKTICVEDTFSGKQFLDKVLEILIGDDD